MGKGKALAEIGCQRRREVFNQACAVLGFMLPKLFFLHDPLANQPVGFHHGGIDRRTRLAASLFEDVFYIAMKRC